MPKSRIAIFSGYASPFGRAPSRSYGGPIMSNPRQPPTMGRRSYYVPPEYQYGPLEERKRKTKPVRKGYRVAKKRNTKKMRAAMNRFSKAAKSCSRKTKVRGSFRACMRKTLKKSKR